jgi:hypothetical protein
MAIDLTGIISVRKHREDVALGTVTAKRAAASERERTLEQKRGELVASEGEAAAVEENLRGGANAGELNARELRAYLACLTRKQREVAQARKQVQTSVGALTEALNDLDTARADYRQAYVDREKLELRQAQLDRAQRRREAAVEEQEAEESAQALYNVSRA